MKQFLLLLCLISGIGSFAQAPINCGDYSSVGTVNPYGNGYVDPGCGGNVPGTVSGPGVWTGAGCAGFITSTVNGPAVNCLVVSYGAVNTDDYGTISTNTGGNLTLTGVNMNVVGNVVGPYNCGGQSYGNVLLTVCSDVPFTSVTLTNTGCTSGWVVNCASQASCVGSGCSVPCLITNLTANIGACIVGPNTYSTSGIIEFTDQPTTGQLIIEDCNGNQNVFNAPFTSPQAYNITGQTADGGPCDVTAYFTADLLCTQTINYTAPQCICNIDMFNANIGLCNQLTDTYCISGDVSFSTPPGGGTMIVEVDNGTLIYDTVINPPFVSGQTWSICGIPSNGAASTVTVYFSNNPGCSSTIGYNAPTSCACSADIGTFSANITGSSGNNYVLCFGDQIDINSNNDWTGPGEMFNPPGPPYVPGVSWLLYSCPPTVALTPDPLNTVPSDPCFLGLVSATDMQDINNGGSWFNAFPGGTFTNNTLYFVPITMYDQIGGTYSYVNGTIPCYELGAPYAVQYLPVFSFSFTDDCLAGTADITVNGGLPAVDGSNFTGSNLLPATASFVNTTASNGGVIQITGLQGGDMWSFDVTDGNGCPYTVSGGPFPPLQNPGFNYPQTSWCTSEAPMNPIITGAPGGTFTSSPAGLTINPASGQITPATSTPGTYNITYTTSGACFDDSSIVVNIAATPSVNPIADQVICEGAIFAAINFTGSIGTTFNWANNNTNIGLGAAGTGNIAAFAGQSTGGAEVATITVTPTAGTCVGTIQTFDLTTNALDDAAYTYPSGLTYCQTGTDPSATITGTAGGTFSYTVVSGGPTLSINTSTGNITLGTSDLGVYDITYTTPGVCPQSSALQLTITAAPIADFTLGVYCQNDLDPLPTFINGGTGGVFSSTAGLSITPGTGMVDLSASTPGIYTVTNSINVPGCALATYMDDITINELPMASISGSANICSGDPLPNLTVDITAGVPSWSLTYNFNGAPTTVNAVATPYMINSAAVGTYDLVSITDGNGCTSTLVGQAVVGVFQTPVVDPHPNQAVCDGNDLTVLPFTSTPAGATFAWTNTSGVDLGFGLSGTGNIGTFTGQNGTTLPIQVNMEVIPTSADGCVGPALNFVITVNPLPVVNFTGAPLQGCEPLTVVFDNLSNPAGQNCEWSFGDGNTTLGCGTVFNTYSAGDYNVSLTVTTAAGCMATTTFNNYVNVTTRPIASFTFAPQNIDVMDPVVDFNNNSTNATSYEWNFGDGSPLSMQENPAHLYPQEPEDYLVTLVAFDPNGWCPDTVQQIIVVDDVILFYVPNVMTPDGDLFNEIFQPVFTSGFDKFDYHLLIFNRWGEVIFESFNADIGWNGHYGDGGLVADGVYIWQIEFKETMSDRHHTHRGHVTVLK